VKQCLQLEILTIIVEENRSDAELELGVPRGFQGWGFRTWDRRAPARHPVRSSLIFHKQSISPGVCPGFFVGVGNRGRVIAECGIGSVGVRLGGSFFEYRGCSLGEDDRHKEL